MNKLSSDSSFVTQFSLFIRTHPAYVVGFIILALLLYVVLPQLGSFQNSFSIVKKADVIWVVVAVGLALANYVAAAGMYSALALQRLRFIPTLIVQLASTLANRLLPAGSGAIGVNYEYLRTHRHTSAEATAVVALNNTIGLVGHSILLGLVCLFRPSVFEGLYFSSFRTPQLWTVASILSLLLLVLLASRTVRQRCKTFVLQMRKSFARYHTHPLRVVAALVFSLCLTSLHVLCLWACSQALGVSMSLEATLIVLSMAVVGSVVTPAPGGLVGVEAAATAGFIAFGATAAPALAVTLLYRFITYWCMLLIGLIASIIVVRRRYIH